MLVRSLVRPDMAMNSLYAFERSLVPTEENAQGCGDMTDR